MEGRMTPAVLLATIICLSKARIAIADAEVTSMNPRQGSLNGGTRVTIQGRGFAENQFNFGDGNSHLGNRVVMVSGTMEHECDIHLDGCHETQLMCYTRPMPEGNYHIRVFVDGIELPYQDTCGRNRNLCTFDARMQNTPRIMSLEPKTGPPHQLVSMRARMFTQLYETNNETNTNGRGNIRITRVWAHGQKCELRKPDSDEHYGLLLDDGGKSVNGKIVCLNEGTYVGNLNISFLINGAYGRSNPDNDILQVTGGLRIGMQQTYAEISSLTPTVGSLEGRTSVTIAGKHFDESDSDAEIRVGGLECERVASVKNNAIVCETASAPDVERSHYIGNRGLDIEIWDDDDTINSVREDLTKATYLSNPTAGQVHTDFFSYSDSSIQTFVARLRGYFVAPSDSDYTFFIKCDDRAILLFSETGDPDDKVQIAECQGPANNYYRYTEQQSALLSLEKGKMYYLEGLLLDLGGDGMITVAVHMHKTNYLSYQAGNVRNEEQVITTKSTVINEQQSIKLSDLATKPEVHEVQELDVTSGGSLGSAIFRLGMNGVYTSQLNLLSSPTQIRSALHLLPSIAPDRVTVTSVEIRNGRRISVTFHSERGDWDDLEFMQDGDVNVSSTVREVTKGQPSGNVWVPAFQGRLAPAISTTASANDLKNSLEGLFGARCPSTMAAPSGRAFFNDYESNLGLNAGGPIVSDVEAYCGRHSVRNPNYLFLKGNREPDVNIANNPFLCFAYMGALQNRILLRYEITEAGSTTTRIQQDTFTDVDLPHSRKSWTYTCIDIWHLVRTRRPQTTRAIMEQITVWRENDNEDMWIDIVYLGIRATTSDTIGMTRYQRLLPVNWFVKDVTVTGDSSTGYNVDLSILNCEHNLPLFETGHAVVQAGSNPDRAIYRGNNWAEGASVTVTRQAAASPPVGGQFSLTYGNKLLSGLSPAIEADDLSEELGSLRGAGSVTVKRTGTCAGYTWEAEFATRGGDHPQLVVDQSDVTGNEVTITTSTKTEGGIFFDPIRGDMLRTYHTTPQITVKINDIPSICNGDCSYRWSAEATPTVTGINPSQGSYVRGTILTITGSGFGSSADVMIGGVACDITQITEDEITCSIGQGPAGSHLVEVVVHGKGLANHMGEDKMFTYEFGVSGIDPATGSTAGGTLLEISGTGFGPNLVVTLDDSPCIVSDSSYTTIHCRTQEGTGVVTVRVSDGIHTDTHDSFTFVTPAAVVSSISSAIGKVDGSQSIEITGVNFGDTAPYENAVTVGEKACEIVSWSDTSITVILPALPQGSYPLHVMNDQQGFADTSINSIPEVEYTFKVTDVNPRYGSLQGGARITVTGEGFSNTAENNAIEIGDVSCIVMTSSESHVECIVDNPSKVHTISNQGIHPIYGAGYAWSERSLDIILGDFVQWQWMTPDLVQNINGYRVEQVDKATSVTPTEDGFSSGDNPIRNGAFLYQFTNTGVHHYHSGPVDSLGVINMRGVITVSPGISFAEGLVMKIGHIEAQYLDSGVERKEHKSACTDVTEPITGCSDNPPIDDYAVFTFAFWDCLTPSIESITPTTGTTNTDIVVTGAGFGHMDCQNIITIGQHQCDIISSAMNSVTCRINPDNEAMIGTLHQVSMVVRNRGSAINTIQSNRDRMFQLMPSVTGVSPAEGSTEGGTLVTLTGSGFSGHANTTIIAMGTATCAVQSVSYTQIICKTTSALVTGNVDVQVMVGVAGGAFVAECEGACSFEFTPQRTPRITSYFPETISEAGSEVTLSGSSLGNAVEDLSIAIGDESCSVTSASDTEVVCNVGSPLVGMQLVTLRRDNWGFGIMNPAVINVDATISSMSPESGSIAGGTEISISGLGFMVDDTSVTIGGNACTITSITRTMITCTTAAGSEGEEELIIVSNTVTYPPQQYTYDTALTPTVTSVSPTSGNSGDSITITGSGFGTDLGVVSVSVDGAVCSVSSVTDTSIDCTLGDHSAGTFDLSINVAPKGLASGSVQFTYEIAVDALNPASGSFGGDQLIQVTGRGFDSEETTVTVCGEPCIIEGSPTATNVLCRTPTLPGSGSQACPVEASVRQASDTLSDGFTFDDSLTPVIADVTPRRGGTGGGTRITISGSGFGDDQDGVDVSIAGSECIISSISDGEIVCVTEPRHPCIQAKVRVEINNNGIARQENADFEYIDLWSSRFSWGGGPLPEEGDFVVIPADMTMVLDVDTPVLKMILIQGGKLIFDEKDVELKAENILIVDGGVFQVGTEEEPFQHKAIITMYGHVRSQEMPIYGTKVLAVRNGTLDLHGKPVGRTWTKLVRTAAAGSYTITLQDDVSWKVGDEIGIASTGTRHSQRENEKKTIVAINGRTITLESPLEYEHLGNTVHVSGEYSVEARAEVGLLSHNIIFRGSDNTDWHDYIERCREGFHTGEFAVQTCFQGRFGEELGSDEFGAQILMHAPTYDEDLVTGRIENVEFTYVGQAFRLGRYAIHYHLNGDMRGSYVRGCSGHQSFNRFVNIHASNYIMVENNVIYNVMGGAYFFEDGVEKGSTFQHNLAIFVRSSTSLQNDDITPAAFWVTNPNNTIQHNAAAGGTHFGFWYRMHEHPDGPSFDPNICPRNVPLGIFQDNSCHSQGWFGIWIFQSYHPMVGGTCSSNIPTPAKFYTLTTWNCERGAESTGTGSIQLIDFVLVNNELAGFEMKLLERNALYSDDGPMIKGGVVAAGVPGLDNQASSSAKAIILPYGRGLIVKDTLFVNFASERRAVFGVTHITCDTEDDNGGFTYELENLSFDNSPNKVFWRWPHEAILVDKDGSFTGIPGGKAVPATGTNPPSCTTNPEHSVNSAVPGVVCPADVNFYRYSWNNARPSSISFRDVTLTNRYGSTRSIWRDKRLTHGNGWMALLVDKEVTVQEWDNSNHITNISYDGVAYDFMTPEDHVLIQFNFTQSLDRFTVTPVRRDESEVPLSVTASHSGDWTYNTESNEFAFILSNHDSGHPNGRHSRVDRDVNFRVHQCLFADCIIPPDPNTIPPPDERPDWAELWSDRETWRYAEDGWGGNYGNGDYGPPRDNRDIMIRGDTWVVADIALPRIKKLYVYGTLELEHKPDSDGNYMDFTLDCSHIIIIGGRLIVGWEDNPFRGNAKIILRGDHYSEEVLLPGGPTIGAKAIGNFGGLDLHGVSRGVSWTRLDKTAPAGSNFIITSKAVNKWSIGDEVIIPSTSYSSRQTEIRRISNIQSKGDKSRVYLDEPLHYRHTVISERVGKKSFRMSAEVGVLTRTVQVIGEDYPQLHQQAFGARVFTGSWVDGVQQYSGWARLSNVEFHHTGQEGFTDFYDPRYSVAFLDIGQVTDIRPSYVKDCAFNYGFAPAIGVFGTNRLTVENNVIYHTIGSSMIISGQRNFIKNNLVSTVIFPGSWNGRFEERAEFDAGIELQDGSNHEFTGNVVAGSERAGIRTNGQSCGSNSLYSDNEVHSSLIGVMVLGDGKKPCSVLNGFTVWKNWFYGIYIQSEASYIVQRCTLLENQVGLFSQVFGPPSANHLTADKSVTVRDTTFIGISDTFDCSDRVVPDASLRLAETAAAWDMSIAPDSAGGMIALSLPAFSSGFNGAPEKPFNGIQAYHAIMGHMKITGVTFANYGSSCSGRRDFVICTGDNNDDAQHPISIEKTTLINVDENNKYFNHRPNIALINLEDCVDMDCDGKKKALVLDTDGTFFGAKGSMFSESEWEWDGDPRRGLGDYRIPRTMLSTIDGQRLNVEDVCPHKGIVRNPRCELKSNYQAWWCPDSVYRMMMLESLDEDTETRRVSPVAVLGEGGYIDLINGPADHAYCLGWTCQERLSTFPLILAMDLSYLIHFSGTTPQDMRMHLLNTDGDDDVVGMSIWYAQPWRLDIYVNHLYRLPQNGAFNDQGQLIYLQETIPGEFMPDLATDGPGASYFDRDTQTLHVIVRGGIPITIRTNPLIFISPEVPFMTVDEFFGENIVENLAKFYGIPPERIRVGEAVREDSRRKKRGLDTVTFIIEITNPPTTSYNVPEPGDLTLSQFHDMTAKIVNMFQLDRKTLEKELNITLVNLKVTEPPPPTDSVEWREIATVVHENQADAADVFRPQPLQVPAVMHIARHLEMLHEGTAFPVQPALGFMGPDGQTVSQLGSIMAPWIVEAQLMLLGEESNPNARLLGETTAPFSGSAATFSNLAISHSGRYAIRFTIRYPVEASHFYVTTEEITVPTRPITGRIVEAEASITAQERSVIVTELVDKVTQERIKDVGWRGHEWTCSVENERKVIYHGHITGLSSVEIEPDFGHATFENLLFSSSGRAALDFRCITSPQEYDVSFVGIITILDANYKEPEVEVTKKVQLKFSGDYQSVAYGEEPYIEVALYNHIWHSYQNIIIDNFEITEGSILAAFTLSGGNDDIEKTLIGLWEDIKGPLEIDFGGSEPLVSVQKMWVDGEPFSIIDEPNPGNLSTGAIIGIAVAVALLFIILVVVLLMALCKSKSRVTDSRPSSANSDCKIAWDDETPVSPRQVSPETLSYADEEHITNIGQPWSGFSKNKIYPEDV